jgi:hypothetical protein
MSTGEFNPYHQWLGLDVKSTQPNYYELIGIDSHETDAEKITAAAAIASSRVRSFRPGERAPMWARLLDEIVAAQRCLVDPQQRAEYDRSLQDRRGAGGPVSRRPAPRTKHPAPESPPTESGPTRPGVVPMSGPATPAAGNVFPTAPAPASASRPQAAQPATVPPGMGQPGMGYPAPGTPYPTALPYAAPPGYPLAPGTAVPVATPVQAPGSPYAYAPPGYGTGTPVMPAYPAPPGTPSAMQPPGAWGGTPPAAYGVPPAAVPIGGPWGAAPGTPGYAASPMAPIGSAVPVPVAAPLASDLDEPFTAALSSSPRHGQEKEKRRSPPAEGRERSNVTTLMTLAISLGTVLVIVSLGVLLAMLLKSPAGSDNGKSQAHSGKTASASSKGEKGGKKERTFKPTSKQQEEAERQLARGDLTLGAGRKPGGPGGAKERRDWDPAWSPPRSHDDPFDVPPTPLPRDLDPEGERGSDAPASKSLTETMPVAKPDDPAATPAGKDPVTDPRTDAPPAKPKPRPDGPPPTAEQVASLAKSLAAARNAVQGGNFAAAVDELGPLENLPMLPEHWAKFQRLQQLAQHAQSFRSAVAEALGDLRPGDTIDIGSSTKASVVKSAKDSITIRVAGLGKNQSFSAEQLPVGLALGIADAGLNQNNPATLAQKAAFLATLKNASPEQVALARQWFQEAAGRGAAFGDLGPVLDDKYDLEKDLK